MMESRRAKNAVDTHARLSPPAGASPDRYVGHEVLAPLVSGDIDLELIGIHVKMAGKAPDDVGPDGRQGVGRELHMILYQYLNQALLRDIRALMRARGRVLLAPASEDGIQEAHLMCSSPS
ncbi:hypothetical protein NITHO_350003 [Nitrolancea hollandica Lb]|uniref:Uncharacterized protein n=1 Tax=Nitrolancea hollandica Lb TaxID=1129897 RepID=I4EIH7_9BACT|nr:hypothetical protein NITHO_350003 [Nitrolancea hollandica Lb]